jgi:hypothetical protein
VSRPLCVDAANLGAWWCPGVTTYSMVLDAAKRSVARTGKPERVHDHPKGGRCSQRCQWVRPAKPTDIRR